MCYHYIPRLASKLHTDKKPSVLESRKKFDFVKLVRSELLTVTYFLKDRRCKYGFTWHMLECVDFDECEKFDFCSGKLHCTNTPGSYYCGCKIGFSVENTDCLDVDECKNSSVSLCPGEAYCHNTEGSFVCTCKDGYEGELCSDVDECLTKCDANAECKNTDGSFECSCKEGYYGNGDYCTRGQCNEASCPANQTCISSTSIDCRCKDGFQFDDHFNCTDIDECLIKSNCDVNANCVNLSSRYYCTANCQLGFEANEFGKCVDVDECASKNTCDKNADCSNTEGSYICTCKIGFIGNGTSCENVCYKFDRNGTCIEIDDCKVENDCDIHAKCTKSTGNYTCSCGENFIGNGKICICPKGYLLSDRNCIAVNVINAVNILVLATDVRMEYGILKYEWKPTMRIAPSGDQKETNCFEADEGIEAMNACSLLWQNQLHIFG